jgi:hypothetical protein
MSLRWPPSRLPDRPRFSAYRPKRGGVVTDSLWETLGAQSRDLNRGFVVQGQHLLPILLPQNLLRLVRRHGRRCPFFHGYKFPRFMPDVDLSRAGDLLLRIRHQFLPLRQPARSAGNGK